MGHNVITITDAETGDQETVFAAPDNTTMARALWVFLIENLRPGLIVELSLPRLGILSQETAVKLSPERYAAIMNQEERASDQPEKVTR